MCNYLDAQGEDPVNRTRSGSTVETKAGQTDTRHRRGEGRRPPQALGRVSQLGGGEDTSLQRRAPVSGRGRDVRQWPFIVAIRKTWDETGQPEPPPRWIAGPMGARVDPEDKEALRRTLADVLT